MEACNLGPYLEADCKPCQVSPKDEHALAAVKSPVGSPYIHHDALPWCHHPSP